MSATPARSAPASAQARQVPAPAPASPGPPSNPPPPPDHGSDLLARLAEPFDPSVISWKPSAVSWRDPENPVAKALAYADQRAYSDRLNSVVGPDGWTRDYSVYVVSGIDRTITQKTNGQREETLVPNQAKVFVVARVAVHALGTHCGTGESWVDDDNALTSAEAQAFKRACVCFGLGRYLYELPETEWLPLDRHTRQLKVTPTLPDWALPRKHCQACLHPIEARKINRVHYTAEALVRRSRDLYSKELCADCQIERARTAQQAVKKEEMSQPTAAG